MKSKTNKKLTLVTLLLTVAALTVAIYFGSMPETV